MGGDSLVAFDEDGVRIVFKMRKGEDNSDTIIKAIISNSNPDDLEEFDLQVAVPKVRILIEIVIMIINNDSLVSWREWLI